MRASLPSVTAPPAPDTQAETRTADVCPSGSVRRAAGSLLAQPITAGSLAGYSLGAVAAFHLAYTVPGCSVLVLPYLFCVAQLARAHTPRGAFYSGLAVGLACYAPQTLCFWRIFSGGACALWLVLAFWVGLFATLSRLCLRRFGTIVGTACLPVLWTGLEYFRSELYYLRFSWLTVGFAFPEAPAVLAALGSYGAGFAAMAVGAAAGALPRKSAFAAGTLSLAILAATVRVVTPPTAAATGRGPRVAGVQLEAPIDEEVVRALDRVIAKHPDSELIMLCEYCFQGPPPEAVRAWCRRHQRFLVAGGKDPVADEDFYDTAFVVDPTGNIVFRQAKSVPIQFFRDGRPAREQRLWESPWGRLGICICYDLSYTRVVDRLVRLGAQGLLVPTMDDLSWGRQEHEHHARVAPVRSVEYGLPIFRVGSCGISQLTDAAGHTLATTAFPGDGAIVAGRLGLVERGRLLPDRWLASFCVGGTAALGMLHALTGARVRWTQPRKNSSVAGRPSEATGPP